jgi:hypothetical protein
MNLASPAPQVEPATAEKAAKVGPATADQAMETEAATASPALPVASPTTVEDPLRFAKSSPEAPSPLSVKELRGGSGSDFESYAAVLRGAPTKNVLQRLLPCMYGDRDFVTYGEVKKYLLVKGGAVCFVFGTETDLQPYYAIQLDEVYPIQEDPQQPDPCSITVSPVTGTNLPRTEMVTILLKYKSNQKQAFQVTFDTKNDPELARRFYQIAQAAGEKCSHGDEDNKGDPVSASVQKAVMAGKEAAKAQPDI